MRAFDWSSAPYRVEFKLRAFILLHLFRLHCICVCLARLNILLFIRGLKASRARGSTQRAESLLRSGGRSAGGYLPGRTRACYGDNATEHVIWFLSPKEGEIYKYIVSHFKELAKIKLFTKPGLERGEKKWHKPLRTSIHHCFDFLSSPSLSCHFFFSLTLWLSIFHEKAAHEHYVSVFFFSFVSYEALLKDGSANLCVLYPNCTSTVNFCINPDMFLFRACERHFKYCENIQINNIQNCIRANWFCCHCGLVTLKYKIDTIVIEKK